MIRGLGILVVFLGLLLMPAMATAVVVDINVTGKEPDATVTLELELQDGTTQQVTTDDSGFHVYANRGTYLATVVVVDDDGGTGYVQLEVSVGRRRWRSAR